MSHIEALVAQVKACDECKDHLPLGPRPILQIHPQSRILIAGQAPGSKVHESGIPFDDESGRRLRSWLGVSREQFYNPKHIAILPMGFCYPGRGASGDLPPRPECAAKWREKTLCSLKALELTIVIGKYAQEYHLSVRGRSVTRHVKAWREYWPTIIPLPHPSPRNNRWLVRNPWFETDVLPRLRERVAEILAR